MTRALALLSMLTATACFGDWVGTQEGGTTGTMVATTSGSTSPLGTTSSTTSSTSSTTVAGTSTTAEPSSSGSTTGSPLCEQLNVLLVLDVSVSMNDYGEGILNTVFALGAMVENVVAELANYHIAFTLNAPVTVNAQAAELPRGQTCDGLGMLLRGQGGCGAMLDGRPYINPEDDLTASLNCLAGSFLFAPPGGDFEHRQALDALDSFFNVDGLEAVSQCNEGFHRPGEPLVVVLIMDEEDAGFFPPGYYVARAIQSQGDTSLANVAFLVIGANPDACDETGTDTDTDTDTDGGLTCSAVPVCRVETFLEQAYGGFEDDRVRRLNLCRSLTDDPGQLAQEITSHLTELYGLICD